MIVSPEFASCLNPGDDVLVTSRGTGMDGWDAEIVAGAPLGADATTNGIVLEGNVVPDDLPSVISLSPAGEESFAVEVARLSRSVVFSAEREDVDLPEGEVGHGGHLLILDTPGVTQKISGVEIRGFGQQGVLGRYPINFVNSASSSSVVSKNVIRESNQRCVNVDATDDILVEDNVAYDVLGHCMSLDTGAETGNRFTNNLVAKNGNLVVLPSSADGGGASSSTGEDAAAASFWITNPSNHYVGNVAAGSEGDGFWFNTEPQAPNGMVPQTMALGTFRDNAAHSCGSNGVALEQPGWMPDQQSFLDGLHSYKNQLAGVVLLNSRNVILRDALLADNRMCVEYRGVDAAAPGGNNKVVRSRCVGRSENALSSLGGNPAPCHPSGGDTSWDVDGIRGVKFAYDEIPGAELSLTDVTFANFGASHVGCASGGGGLALFPFEAESGGGKPMDVGPRLSGVVFENSENAAFDVPCALVGGGGATGKQDIFLEDPSGTMAGPSPGFFVQASGDMLAFLGDSSCVPLHEGCVQFCPNECLRKVYFKTMVGDEGPFRIEVTKEGGGTTTPLTTHSFEGDAASNVFDHQEGFGVMLPGGEYMIQFVTVDGNERVYPVVEDLWFGEAPRCSGYVTEDSIALPLSVYRNTSAYRDAQSDNERTSMTCAADLTTDAPTATPSRTPSSTPSTSPTSSPTVSPTESPSFSPSASPSRSPSESNECDPNPCKNGGTCTDLVNAYECDCTVSSPLHTGTNCDEPLAAWMSGKHGIGFRIEGGDSPITSQFCDGDAITELVDQIITSFVDAFPVGTPFQPLSYVILGISSGANGDQYIGPNVHLENLLGNGAVSKCDIFGQIADALEPHNINVIGYMAAQGPAQLKAGERSTWDHPDSNTRTDKELSGFQLDGTPVEAQDVNSANLGYADRGALCAALPDVHGNRNDGSAVNIEPAENRLVDCSNLPNCPCAPSTRKWVKFVEDTYGGFTDDADRKAKLKTAYAEKIVRPYTELYAQKSNFKGFWFDQGSTDPDDSHADNALIVQNIREVMPFASVAINDAFEGGKIPLQNNNPGLEDYTYGHVSPVGTTPPNSCRNYGMVLSAEASDGGYVYESVTPKWNADWWDSGCDSQCSASTEFTYDTTPALKSLAHVFMPIATKWNTGDIRGGWMEEWEDESHQGTAGAEWMARVLDAGGAWTWNIPLAYNTDSGDNSCRYREDGTTLNVLMGHCGPYDEVELLKDIYAKLGTVTADGYSNDFMGMNPDRYYNECDGPLIGGVTTTPPPLCNPRGGVDDPLWKYNNLKPCSASGYWSETNGRCDDPNNAYVGTDNVPVNVACPNACRVTCEEYALEYEDHYGFPPS
uniref:EGF-like domain-containing protein n=1 Tax=Odontella aurita TaxID=265563 RepID=A0A7S4MN85_9STRA